MGHSGGSLFCGVTTSASKWCCCCWPDGTGHCIYGRIDSFVCLGMVGSWFWPGVRGSNWFCNSRYKRIDHFWKNGIVAHTSRGDVASGGLAWCVALCVGVGHSCSTHCCHCCLRRSATSICSHFIWSMGCAFDVCDIAMDGSSVAHVGRSRRH